MYNGIERIRRGYSSLKPMEKKVADYILKKPNEILDMPISKLAKNAGASEATIIRMCRSVHIKGVRELKLSISAYMVQEEKPIDRYKDISADANLSEIIKYVSTNNIHSINSTLTLVDEKDMNKAIILLDKARKVIAIGVGASAIVALDFEQKLKRINRWCEALVDSHTQLTSAIHLTNQDVVVAISYSGETKEIIDALKVSKQNEANIISVTGYGTNSIQKLSSINLYASPIEQSIRSSATASRIAQLNLIDILFTGLASLDFSKSVDYLDKTREVIQKKF